jgi:hypothetical protein
LHVTLGHRLKCLAPELTTRSVLEKLCAVQMIDAYIPTTDGRELMLTRYTQPEAELRGSCWSVSRSLCRLSRRPGHHREPRVVQTYGVHP